MQREFQGRRMSRLALRKGGFSYLSEDEAQEERVEKDFRLLQKASKPVLDAVLLKPETF